MPSGTAISVAPPVHSSVPTMAGPMPGPERRDTTGMVAVKKSGKERNATEAPRENNDHRIKTSGIVIATNAAIMSVVIAQFLIVRHDSLGSRLIARI